MENLSLPVGNNLNLIVDYLERAAQFQRLASDEENATLRERLMGQADAYRKLATKRAETIGADLSNLPDRSRPGD